MKIRIFTYKVNQTIICGGKGKIEFCSLRELRRGQKPGLVDSRLDSRVRISSHPTLHGWRWCQSHARLIKVPNPG